MRTLYGWRPGLRLAFWAGALAVALVIVPLAAAAAGALVFPIDFVARMLGLGGAGGLTGAYVRAVQQAFAPDGFPTWLPRLVVLVLGLAAFAVASSAVLTAGRRRQRGPFWWRGVGSPLSSREAVAHCWRALWDLLRGAAALREPPPVELAGRYVDLLVDNLGQPGFRELLITVHDLDAHRDLVFALVAESRRRGLIRRASTVAADARRAEVLDLAGGARAHLADAIAASLSVPIVTDAHAMTFASDAYWRGETHRLCDRPGSLTRILDELAELGVEQAVIVSAAPELTGPHALAAGRARRQGPRGRVPAIGGSVSRSRCDAARRGARAGDVHLHDSSGHNPIGPFDFGGEYDDRSDRRQPLTELMSLGYEDAYHQFIEPVVGASGDRVGVKRKTQKTENAKLENVETDGVTFRFRFSFYVPRASRALSGAIAASCRNCVMISCSRALTDPASSGPNFSTNARIGMTAFAIDRWPPALPISAK